MKVLHVFKTYITDSTGGVEKTIQQLCLATSKQGINNSVFCLTHNPKIDKVCSPEAEVYRYPINFSLASTPFSWSAIKGFRSVAAEADIIHYHFPWPFADMLHLLTNPGKPTVLTYHSDIIRQQFALKWYRPMMHHFLQKMDRIVATSPQYFHTSPTLQRFSHKINIIPIGLDKATYPQPSAERLQYWQNIVGESFFLFVGVMRYYKGLPTLLLAAQKLPTKIVIVGSGPMEQELKQQQKQLKLSNVYFLGTISEEDKVALLSLALAVIFPSQLRSEAFGVSLLEGAMFGKPLISTEIGTGTGYVNIDEETGLSVPPADAPALHNAMQWMLNNPVDTAKMGVQAEQRYQDKFTANKMADKYIAIYKKLVTCPK